MRIAGLWLSLTIAVPAAAQKVPGGWRHAEVLAESDNCGACHISHVRTGVSPTLKSDGDGGRVRPWLEMQAPGVGDASLTCLRCHWTDQGRRREPEFALQRLGGGRFVGPDLVDDHPLGTTDPATLRMRDGRAPGLSRPRAMSDRDEIECTTCHDPHTPGAAAPRGAELLRLCGNCHAVEEASLDRHRGVSCTGCHQVHEARQRQFLRETTVEFMCTSCHASPGAPPVTRLRDEAERDGPVAISPSHNPGTNCIQCHDVHRAR